MTRIVKEYDQRQEELLNTAQALFYTKGYDQTSVRDIIDRIGIAKGTFYHYFDSKLALLEALVEHLISQSLDLFEAIAKDDSLDALPKMTRMLNLISNWKTERKEELLVIVNALYSDENILLMHKLQERSVSAVTPILADVIQQGMDEGVFDVESAEVAAEIFIQVAQGFSEGFARTLLNREDYDDPISLVRRKKAAYERAIERVLGAPTNSLSLFDEAILTDWFN